MVKIKHLSIYILISLFSVSCEKGHRSDCFKSQGPYAVETRYPTAPFNTIEVRDKINLFLFQDSLNYISLEGGENLLAGIETVVENSVLIISDKNKCNWVRSLNYSTNVYIHYTNIFKLIANNSGDNHFLTTHNGDSLKIEYWEGSGTTYADINVNNSLLAVHAGSGNIVAKGYSGVSVVYNSGCGPIDAGELLSNTTFMRSRSNHNVIVNVKDWLIAEIDWTGDVYYKGNPAQMDIYERNTGKLIHID